MNPGWRMSTQAMRWKSFLIDRHPDELRTDAGNAERSPIWRMPLLALILFALIIAGAGSVLYFSAKRSVTLATHDNLESIAKLKVGQIERWLDERRKDAQLSIDNPLFADELQQWLDGGMRDGRKRERLLVQLKGLSGASHYRDVSIRAAADGALLLTSSGRTDAARDRIEAMTTAKERRPSVEDFHFLAAGSPVISLNFYFPITLAGRSQPLGVVEIEADPAAFLFPLLRQWPGSSPSAETLLIKAEGETLVYLNSLRHRPNAALRFSLPVSNPGLLAAQAIRGHTGPLIGVDYRDVPSLGYALPVAGTAWIMISKIDAGEAYALLNTATLFCAVAAFILLLLAAWWIIEHDRYAEARYRDIGERKQMEQALLASEDRFRQAFEHAPIGMAMVGLDGRFLAVNPATCRLTGYSQAELMTMTFRDITYPVDLDQDANWVSTLAASKEASSQVEKRAVHKDGRILYLSIGRTLVKDHDGRPLYVLSQTQDISERKEALARIQKLSQLKAAISEMNRAIVHSSSPEEVFRAVCQACVDHGCFWLAWIGLANPATQRIEPIEVAGPASGYLDGLAISILPDVPEGRGPSATAYRERRLYICNDFSSDPAIGPWRDRAAAHCLSSSIALPLLRGGRPYGVLTVYGPEKNFFDDESVSLLGEMAENISFAVDQFDREAQRRQAENALRQSEEKFRTLVENLPQKIFVKDSSLAYLACNVPYARDLGIAPDRIAGMTDYDFYPAELAEKYGRDDRRVMAAGEVVDIQEEYLHEGQEKFVHTVKAPFRNEQGEIVGVLGVFWDITESKRAGKRLEELSHRLVALQEEERRRLAGELHDRASPNLAAIKINLRTLAGSLPAAVLADVDSCLEDALALLDDTTADIREICAELRPTVLDYAGLIPALEGYAAQFMKRTAISVRVKAPQDWVRLDTHIESTLFRIVQEAMTNCAKHACARKIDIEFANRGRHVTLTIKDDGFGFDSGAIGQNGNIPGLGLITMKERAEFVGGRFTVTAHPATGTEIRVELGNPIEPGRNAAAAASGMRRSESSLPEMPSA